MRAPAVVLLSSGSTDKGINDWMSQAVVLTSDGSRIIGEYDGYGGVGGYDDGLDGEVCLHVACWEKAGKPEVGRYDSGSEPAEDQGYFFDDGDHDMIDPRITEGRDELLKKGQEARKQRRFDQKAQEVARWIKQGPIDEKDPPWTQRFSVSHKFEPSKKGRGSVAIRNQWVMSDRDYEFFQDDETRTFHGTEEEAHALCAKLWDEFVASDECRALMARAEELRIEDQRRYEAQLREKGRYEVGYGNSKKKGDTVGGGSPCSRSLYYVQDRLTFDRVAVFDYEGEPQHFESDIYYDGNHSPAWEARVEENRADDRARRAKAEAEAKRLNEQWAAEGYPVDWKED